MKKVFMLIDNYSNDESNDSRRSGVTIIGTFSSFEKAAEALKNATVNNLLCDEHGDVVPKIEKIKFDEMPDERTRVIDVVNVDDVDDHRELWLHWITVESIPLDFDKMIHYMVG